MDQGPTDRRTSPDVASGRRGGPAPAHVRPFFERPAVPAQPNTQAAAADDNTRIVTQSGHHLVQGDVLGRLDHRHDECLMSVKARASWLALTPRRALTCLSGTSDPDDRCGNADPEPRRHRARGCPSIRRIQNPLSKIIPVSS